MIVKNEGLNGTIAKDSESYIVDIIYSGWGSLGLYEILDKLNLIKKLEEMKAGETIIFQDRFVVR